MSRYFAEYSKGAELRFITGKITFKGYENPAWFPVLLLVFHAGKVNNTFKTVSVCELKELNEQTNPNRFL